MKAKQHWTIGLGLAVIAGLAFISVTLPAQARGPWAHGDQPDIIRPGRDQGILPLPVIERHIRPMMGNADYLGPEFDSRTSIYRLKFMYQGAVIWIDVDGRTGSILRRSGR